MKQTPLKRKTPLKAKTQLTTKKPWKPKKSKAARSKEFPESVKNIVRQRSGNMCERCKRRPLDEFHHCTYRSAGGTSELSNCLGLCIWCHKEDADSAHKSRATRMWCVAEAKRLAEVELVDSEVTCTT